MECEGPNELSVDWGGDDDSDDGASFGGGE